ncbi:hypothetical protein MBM_02955 [Drepanopeziza brunnea f. sp. 'multigermtubi' MB_m1]|uniref:Uncharacterized protein n=1 Tax=Marssonina brunnea f. sp. multigermtubi (strain MB_m1) TaxID=1072389 RepID=K1XD40_MARBU|nr:uncharacterized protein MBM_02955 [Drepanopeziza brunnea f. sp. 'multigermtubi' MB_m1]EKD18713.1 hypothetical protein MBM_02955 [Drepanopeziza brunnea f. sp. 'multigermtubi' MB_m1]
MRSLQNHCGFVIALISAEVSPVRDGGRQIWNEPIVIYQPGSPPPSKAACLLATPKVSQASNIVDLDHESTPSTR